MKVLVVGLGERGKRYKDHLEFRGIEVRTVDPDGDADLPDVRQAFGVGKSIYDLAVVTVDPYSRPEVVQFLIDKRVPKILCESPVCGWGQIGDVPDHENVRVAFPYRCHPWVADGLGPKADANWFLFSIRGMAQVPSRGLLLDHVVQAVDILVWKTGFEEVDVARWLDFGPMIGWWIVGRTSKGGVVRILDLVAIAPGYRRYFSIHREGRKALWVKGTSEMFKRMVDSTLSGYYWSTELPTVREALRVQGLLERIRVVAGNAPDWA